MDYLVCGMYVVVCMRCVVFVGVCDSVLLVGGWMGGGVRGKGRVMLTLEWGSGGGGDGMYE